MKVVKCEFKYWNFVRELRMDKRVVSGFIEQVNITENQQDIYMTKNSNNYLIALINDKPVGYIGVIENDIRICTHPDFQGQGVAKLLINECKKKWSNATAKVKTANIPSKNLFLSCGYKIVSSDSSFTYFK